MESSHGAQETLSGIHIIAISILESSILLVLNSPFWVSESKRFNYFSLLTQNCAGLKDFKNCISKKNSSDYFFAREQTARIFFVILIVAFQVEQHSEWSCLRGDASVAHWRREDVERTWRSQGIAQMMY